MTTKIYISISAVFAVSASIALYFNTSISSPTPTAKPAIEVKIGVELPDAGARESKIDEVLSSLDAALSEVKDASVE